MRGRGKGRRRETDWRGLAGAAGLIAASVALAGGLALGLANLLGRWLGVTQTRAPARAERLKLPPGSGRPPVRVSGGTGTLLAAGTGLIVLLLAAAAADAWVHDGRPDDFTSPLPEQRLVGSERLTGYHWIDETAGTVQIPIERAMDLLAERGLPTRGEGGQFEAAGASGPTDGSGGRWAPGEATPRP